MFTGIVTDVGEVRHVEKRGDTHVVIKTHYDVSTVDIGASISCSGVCMTVVDKGNTKDRWFAVTASGETLSKTTLGQWKAGDPVNLAEAMTAVSEAATDQRREWGRKSSELADAYSPAHWADALLSTRR